MAGLPVSTTTGKYYSDQRCCHWDASGLVSADLEHVGMSRSIGSVCAARLARQPW